MKGLSLWQPWATLMALGAKTIETRDWPTDYRGPLAIHATVRWEPEQAYTCLQEPFRTVLSRAYPRAAEVQTDLPRGCIVAVVHLRDVKSTRWLNSLPPGQFPPFEWQFGNFGDGRLMWLTERVQRLAEPVPCRGYQGLWPVEGELLGQVEQQIGVKA